MSNGPPLARMVAFIQLQSKRKVDATPSQTYELNDFGSFETERDEIDSDELCSSTEI